METLKLSDIVVEGLKSLNTVISSDLSKKLISNAVKMALHSDSNIPANPEIYATKPDYTKQAEYAVLTLLFLSIKYNLDSPKFRSLLEDHEISTYAIEELVKIYENNKVELSIKNITTGHSLPHLTNIEWKLTCDIKSSQIDSNSGELNFNIHLGRFKEKTGEREMIADFICNVEELQSLINKLKDIERHCTKLANGPTMNTIGGGTMNNSNK